LLVSDILMPIISFFIPEFFLMKQLAKTGDK